MRNSLHEPVLKALSCNSTKSDATEMKHNDAASVLVYSSELVNLVSFFFKQLLYNFYQKHAIHNVTGLVHKRKKEAQHSHNKRNNIVK